jgi:hypothetical protein
MTPFGLPKKVPLRTAVSVEIIALATVAAFFLPGGEDLYRFYLPQARGCLECGFNPWHTSWILFPISLIPERVLWPLWVFVTLAGLWWVCERLEVNPVSVLLSFPTMGLIWLGQIDILVIVGLTLAVLSPNAYVRGVGLVLASIKPQVAGVAIFILLWYEQDRWRALLVPALVLAASLIVWGPDWPLRWLLSDPEPANHVWRLSPLYPYGLAAFLSVLVVPGKRRKVMASLYASALGVPWFGVYSYTVFLVFLAPWWAVPISYAWLLAYPLLGNLSMKFAWVLPLSLLAFLLWPHLTTWWARLRTRWAEVVAPSDDDPRV